MKKENAIKIINECAQDYHTFLENQNLMFLFGTSENPSFFEAAFLPRHFLHLTGVDLTIKSSSGSSDFYKKALKEQLSVNDFSLSSDGTMLTDEFKYLRSPILRHFSYSDSRLMLLQCVRDCGALFS